MHTDYLIAVDEFCANHHIDNSFISQLHQTGLIQVKTIKETGFIDESQLKQIEKFIRFYYEMDINVEGIETITHLLQRINTMHIEIVGLRNKLILYEAYDHD